MVEPPGHFRRIGVLEIHDDVLIPVEQTVRPGLRCAMRHAGQRELRIGIESFAVKTVKQRRGRCTVEAPVVKAESYSSHRRGAGAFPEVKHNSK